MEIWKVILENGLEVMKFYLVFFCFLGIEWRRERCSKGLAIMLFLGYVVYVVMKSETMPVYLIFITIQMWLIFQIGFLRNIIVSFWIALVISLLDNIAQILIWIYTESIGRSDSDIRIIVSIITIFFLAITVGVIRLRTGRMKVNISVAYGILFSILGMIAVIIVAGVKETILLVGVNERTSLLAVCTGIVLFVQMGMVLVLATSRDLYREKQQLGEALLKNQEEYSRYRAERERDIRNFRHDMNSHMIMLQELNQQNDREGVEQYLKKIIKKLHLSEKKIDVGYETVDAVIRECVYRAEEKGVVLFVKGKIPENCQMELFDLCSIISNLLNNGIEAAESSVTDKEIKLVFRHMDDLLMIHMENTYGGERKKVNGRYETTKADTVNHGLGLNSIRDSLKKYHGTMELKEEKGWFITDISVKCLDNR